MSDKLAAALHEASVYGVGATSDFNQRIILEAAKDNERLRKGIRDYLDGNYDHPRAHRHEPAKGCKHGRFYYEDCCECDADYFSALLGEENRINQQTAQTEK